jgi:hypothetical protein
VATSARISYGALAVLVATWLEEVQTAAGTKLKVCHPGEEDPDEGAFVRFGIGGEHLKRQRGSDEPDHAEVLVTGYLAVGTEQTSAAAIYTLIDRCHEKLRERVGTDADTHKLELKEPRFDPPAAVPIGEERAIVVAEFSIRGIALRTSGTSYTDFMA